ncbi:MAG TPA: carboxypeptidase regulatory-like domain-containing protein [Pyrinomonadaceae bacterium]|nr:carboxypeptidase regulatory-like domain-containing protein [Pyrinomonadaceae bacterium]
MRTNTRPSFLHVLFISFGLILFLSVLTPPSFSKLHPLALQSIGLPLSLAAGDFDEDGVPDLVVGNAKGANGAVELRLGNPDAIYPNSADAQARKRRGEFTTVPFTRIRSSMVLSTNPDFLAAGDFDADDHFDIVAATRADNRLYLFSGDGRGNFGQPKSIRLPGKITSVLEGELERVDGLADLAIGLETDNGPRFLTFRNPRGALNGPPQDFAFLINSGNQTDISKPAEAAAPVFFSRLLPGRRGYEIFPNQERQSPAIGLNIGKASYAINNIDGSQSKAEQILPKDVITLLPMRLNPSALPAFVGIIKGEQNPVLITQQPSSTFTVLNTNDGGVGSLRQAIDDANANTGADTIAFNIPGSGPYSISVQSQLPTITEAVTVDGTTQPGFAGTPLIDLNGANAGSAIGLLVTTSNVVIRGLVINQFTGYCVRFGTSNQTNQNNNILEGNFIGIDSTGHTALGSLGVFVIASTVQIGGTSVAARNVIAPIVRIHADSTCCFGGMETRATIQGNFVGTDLNGQAAVGIGGIHVTDPSSQGSAVATIGGTQPGARNVILGSVDVSPRTNGGTIQGNYIGTELTGSNRLGNGGGISFNGIVGLTIGGTTPAARNVIANGISILSTVGCPPNFPQSPFVLAQGNHIGIDASGNHSLGNTGNGVTIQGVAGAVIGGSGAGNVIAFNGGDGIAVNASCYNLIQSNSIFSNGGLGIRVTSPGPLSPAPILTAAQYAAGTLRIDGTAAGAGNSNLEVQFFSNNECDPSGAGEGQTFLGSQSVTTNSSGIATISAVLSVPVAPGSFITATSTDVNSNTSVFSRCRKINSADISGRVTLNGNGFTGVTMTLDGAQTGTTTTDANGNYLFENLSRAMQYTVTPSLTNYIFNPASQTVPNLGSNTIFNFTAELATYTISGQVLNAGFGFAGVTMNLTGSQTGSVVTNSSGQYSFTVNAGGNYTVTPARQNYSFSPTSTPFTNVHANQTANFDATVFTYNISGKISLNSNGLGGVTVALSGAQTSTTTTNSSGNYSFNNLTAEGNYVVTPSLATYTFSPASRTFDNLSSNQTSADFTAIPPTYIISGLIKNASDQPISAVIVSLTGTTSSTTVSDTNGSFSFAGLTMGGNYVVTPARTNYNFSPSLRTFVNLTSNQTANFTGTLVNYAISGRITKTPNTGVAGISVSLSGSQTAMTTTDGNGDYSFNVPGDGDYTITPSSGNYSFSPASISFDDLSQNQTAANFSATPFPPNLFFSASNFSGNESDGFVTITVNRSGDTSGESKVDFASSNGSASQLGDYEVASGSLTFAAGQASRTFRVLLVDDAYAESAETVNLSLFNPSGGVLIAPTTATVTIVDNDSAGSSSPAARQFVANLTPGQVVPPASSTGFGGGVVLLGPGETTGKVSLIYSQLIGSPFLASIRGPAGPNVNGPIVYHLSNGGSVTNFPINPSSQEVADLRAGLHFMSVHTSGFANGEIRGQLLWNPAEEADFFVRQAYFDFLGRVPDPSGFAFWLNEITQCQSDVQCLRNKRVDVSNAFFYEQEFQQTAAYVLRLYRAAYGNNQPFPNPNPNASFPNEEKKLPSYTVFVADRARVIGGSNLAQRQLDLANLFVTRAEFTAKYPASLATGDQFVDALLATLQTDLGVNLASQRTNLINLFAQGGRGAVMYRLADDNVSNPIANQPLIDAEYNRTFVLGQYFGYLRRNPDIPGFSFWLGQVNGAPLRNIPRQHAMVCSFITSAEYQFRFGPVASRNNNECTQ